MSFMKKSMHILIVVFIFFLLYLGSLYHYLLFHTLAEIFSICIAITVFIITWNSVKFLKNTYLLMVGIAYLFIGCLDLFHTLSYEGMTVFTDYSYHANQLWIAARYFESIVLLVSFIIIKSNRRINIFLLFAVYSALTTAILLSVFVFHNFPIAFIEGVGQTPFKIISEYVVIIILFAATIAIHKNKDALDGKVYRVLLFSLICTIISEASFTTYINNYGITNLLGHYFKILSYYFIYKAIVQTGIREPYDLIFREIKQTEQQLYKQNSALSHQSIADGLTIKEHLALLEQQYAVINRQAKLLDFSHEAIFAWELNGSIFYWNKGAEFMYGYTQEEACGRRSGDLLVSDRSHYPDERKHLEQLGTWSGELKHTTKDGKQLHIESTMQICRDDNDRNVVLEICRDITERHKMEENIRYQNNLLSAIFENMHDAMFVYDSECNIKSMNASAREMYKKHDVEEITIDNVLFGNRFLDLERNPLPVEEYPAQRAFQGEFVKNERMIVENDQWSKIIEVNAKPIVNSQYQIMAIVVSQHDMTELIKKQQAIEEHIIQLQQQNKVLHRQAMLLDLSQEAIFAWHLDGPIIYWNHGAEEMYGYQDDDAVGSMPQHLLHAQFPMEFHELQAILLVDGSWSGIIEHTTKDGRQLIIETRLQIIMNEYGMNTVLETNRDVTARINTENEINKKAAELDNIINSTDDFIWSVGADYRINFCNQSMNAFIKGNYGFEMKIGAYFSDIFKQENALGFLEYLDRVKQEGEYSIDIHSFRGNKTLTYSFYPVHINHELVEILVYGRDITERIKTEQEIVKLNKTLESRVNERTEELRQTVKTLRNFSLTVTHDLKMPLLEIVKCSKQIQHSMHVETNSAKIIDLCSGMNAMILELLNYEEISGIELNREWVDIGKMIMDVFEEQKTITSNLDFQTGIPKVHADKSLMRHVIMNLMSNALKYSAKRESEKLIVGCTREKNEYVFSLKDNGIGFDMEYADKLFNPFERLHNHDEYEGHGLGLATVRNIIARHNGRTWIKGKIDAGTTVYFTLPVEPEGDN